MFARQMALKEIHQKNSKKIHRSFFGQKVSKVFAQREGVKRNSSKKVKNLKKNHRSYFEQKVSKVFAQREGVNRNLSKNK